MPKIRKEPYKHQTFNLSEEVIQKLEELSDFEGMNKSELIEFFIKNWDTGINPTEKLIKLTTDRKKLQNQLNIIDKQIEEISKQITLFEDWKKQKNGRKSQAIMVIERKMIERDNVEEIEKVAKTWQRMTGIPAIELLIEAKENIERKGI